MMRYVLLNTVFLTMLVAASWAMARRTLFAKRYRYTILALLILTAVFDSLIIAMGIVGYNNEHILGVYVGKAPIEDFAYALVAAVFVPALWEYYDKK